MAKANNLDIELVDTVPATAPAEYSKINALGKIPTFVGADGFVLSEAIAIYIYGRFIMIRRACACAGTCSVFVFSRGLFA